MRTPVVISMLCAIGVIAANTQALADEHDNHEHDNHERDNHQYVRHEDWRKGARIQDEDWRRGEHVDYRQYHLRAPPHGYDWRLVDGNYVLAAVATGVIASVVVASVAGH